jgi:hypothetical protein
MKEEEVIGEKGKRVKRGRWRNTFSRLAASPLDLFPFSPFSLLPPSPLIVPACLIL